MSMKNTKIKSDLIDYMNKKESKELCAFGYDDY